MNSSTRKQNLKLKTLKGSDEAGKNCLPKEKSMSPMAKLMATFYGIGQRYWTKVNLKRKSISAYWVQRHAGQAR